MTVFFTADHHFGHENIIKYANRPYDDTTEMDRELIRNWNVVVGPSDTVYHLGDFCLGGGEMAYNYFSKLNGRIIVLLNRWHHDRRWIEDPRYSDGLEGETSYSSKSKYWVEFALPLVSLNSGLVYPNGYLHTVFMCHYPLAEWDRKHYGAVHVHGHSHGKHEGKGRILDVGVDSWISHYTPVSLDQVLYHSGAVNEKGFLQEMD